MDPEDHCRITHAINSYANREKDISEEGTAEHDAWKGSHGYHVLIGQVNTEIKMLVDLRKEAAVHESKKIAEMDDIKKKDGWYWKETVPVDEKELERWRITEKIPRSREELTLVAKEIENLDAIQGPLNDFFTYFTSFGLHNESEDGIYHLIDNDIDLIVDIAEFEDISGRE